MIRDMSLKGCIEFAVATEGMGAEFYAGLAKKFAGSQEISGLFESLGKDEEVHKHQFSELLGQLPQEVALPGSPEKTEYVRAMSISEFFSRERGAFADIERIANRDEALEKVFAFEKATLAFYQAVKELIGDNSVLDQVIQAEKSHVARTMRVMITGEKFRSLQDQWP